MSFWLFLALAHPREGQLGRISCVGHGLRDDVFSGQQFSDEQGAKYYTVGNAVGRTIEGIAEESKGNAGFAFAAGFNDKLLCWICRHRSNKSTG